MVIKYGIDRFVWADCVWPLKILLFVGLLLMTPVIYAGEYQLDKSKDNQVMFLSESPLSDFEVITDKIDGYIYWDGGIDLPDSTRYETSDIYFEVQLNSLDAGNSMYNLHLKEDYLETDKFPYASYKAKINSITEISDTLFEINLLGDFTVHGKSKQIEIIGLAKKIENGFRIMTDFIITITDYKIKIPKLLFVEMDDFIKISLVFYLKQ